jgi:hypothetical protein
MACGRRRAATEDPRRAGQLQGFAARGNRFANQDGVKSDARAAVAGSGLGKASSYGFYMIFA